MASIAECRNDINRYNTLKVRVNTVINYLSSASNNAESLSYTIKNNYTVNDASTPIVTRTNKVKDKITEMYKYLKGTVLPAIDNSITDLNNTIARLEREERERREREERERREREERERREREERERNRYW